MRVINRYILQEVLKGSLLALLILLALLNFFTFTDELTELGKGNYGLKTIFKYILYTSPHNIYELMPSAALIGSLFSLGGMANQRELIAMQAAGATPGHIIRAVLRAGLVLMVFAIGIGEFIAPDAERTAHTLKTNAQKNQVASLSKYGFWVREGNTFVNIRYMDKRESLGNIRIYTLDNEQRLQSISSAKKAIYQDGKWLLRDLRRSLISPERITVEKQDQLTWESVLDPDLLDVVLVSPEHLSVADLAGYLSYLKDNAQESREIELAFWGRFTTPVLTLIMLFATIPFVLNIQRHSSVPHRIAIGAIIGLSFHLFDNLFSNFSLIYELNPLFAAVFPGVVLFSGVIVMRLYSAYKW